MPGSENRYESIVFRAADVKDLTIDDPNPEVAPPPAQPAFQDPAIIGVSVHGASWVRGRC
jgi:protein LSM14